MSETTARAARARSELSETESAFEALRQAYLEEIALSSRDQQDKREKLYLAVHVLQSVRQTLFGFVAAGKIEERPNARSAIAEHSTLLRP